MDSRGFCDFFEILMLEKLRKQFSKSASAEAEMAS